MKKTLLLTILLLSFLFLFTSCEEEVHPAPEEETEIMLDLSSLLPGETIKKSIGNNSIINLEGINLVDGAVIIDGDFNSSRGLGEQEKDLNVFKRHDGTFIPVPDHHSHTIISPEDMGIKEHAEMIIKKDNPHNDFAIKPEEYPG